MRARTRPRRRRSRRSAGRRQAAARDHRGTAEPGRLDRDRALAVAVPYLMMCGFVLGGWLMARAAKLRQRRAAMRAGIQCGEAGHGGRLRRPLLPRAAGYARVVAAGSDAIAGVDPALI